LSPSLPSLSLPLSLPFPFLPLEVGSLNPARRSLGERYKLPQRVWGKAPVEIEFDAF